jgi:hypothetical protein
MKNEELERGPFLIYLYYRNKILWGITDIKKNITFATLKKKKNS